MNNIPIPISFRFTQRCCIAAQHTRMPRIDCTKSARVWANCHSFGKWSWIFAQYASQSMEGTRRITALWLQTICQRTGGSIPTDVGSSFARGNSWSHHRYGGPDGGSEMNAHRKINRTTQLLTQSNSDLISSLNYSQLKKKNYSLNATKINEHFFSLTLKLPSFRMEIAKKDNFKNRFDPNTNKHNTNWMRDFKWILILILFTLFLVLPNSFGTKTTTTHK